MTSNNLELGNIKRTETVAVTRNNSVTIQKATVSNKKTNNRLIGFIDSVLFSRFNVFVKYNFVNLFVVFVLLTGLLWTILYLFTENNALPGHNNFNLWILFTFGHLVGFLFTKIKIPGLLGMLLVGIIAANLSYIRVKNVTIDEDTSSIIRKLALCIILCKAGLSVNPKVLKKLKLQIAKLSIIPCLVEAISFSIISKYILNLPFTWSFLLGFAVTGVSPAVIIPFMYNLQVNRLGTNKGIPTLIMASASFDNIITLTGNSIMVGIVFNQDKLWWNIVKFPLGILIGLAFGILIGFMLNIVRLPHKLNVSSIRALLLLMFAVVVLFGSQKLGFSSTGPLGVLCLAFVCKLVWMRVDSIKKDPNGGIDYTHKVSNLFNNIWFVIFEPLLFTSIGNEINFSKLELRIIGLGLATICIGMILRILATYLCVSFGKFSLKEKFFICFAWLPKATVQAAVGSVALNLAVKQQNSENIYFGTIVLQICVLSIIVTAPLGALLLSLTSTKLLQQETDV